MQLKASAPGSLMLLGEYAALFGKKALVCAIDKRINIRLVSRNDTKVTIQSDRYGYYETDIRKLVIEKPFQFILGTLKLFQNKLNYGCDLIINSQFSDQVGLGSSAAVVAVTLCAVTKWLKIKTSSHHLINVGRRIIRNIQGTGSGADIAASICGGLIAYQAEPLKTEKFTAIFPISLLYSGYKTPTADAIQTVQNYFVTRSKLFASIHQSIAQCAEEGIKVLRKKNWQGFGEVMNIQQGMMESLGVSTPLLRKMIDDLRSQPDILGAKISGSGLGDCVIGLGSLSKGYQFKGNDKVQMIPVKMSLKGCALEKI